MEIWRGIEVVNLEYANMLVDGLFARKVVKTIQIEKYDEELFTMILSQMENVIDGMKANKDYEHSDQREYSPVRTPY